MVAWVWLAMDLDGQDSNIISVFYNHTAQSP